MSGKIKISTIFTGGTISSNTNGKNIVLNINYKYIYNKIKKDPEIKENCSLLKPRSPFMKYSENIGPKDWKSIIKCIVHEIDLDSDAIVITHGTDTMAYTVSAISYVIKELYQEQSSKTSFSPVPIIFTGALLPSEEDAITNLHNSILFAAKLKDKGVYVSSYNNEMKESRLFWGNRLRSVHPFSKNFGSYDNKFTPYPDHGLFNVTRTPDQSQSKPRINYDPESIKFSNDISFFKIYPGFKASSIEDAIKKGSQWIILELYHSGTACIDEETCDLIKVLKKHNGRIFGLPLNSSSNNLYPTTAKLIRKDVGLIPLNMSPESAIIKLMWLLGKEDKNLNIKEKMKEDFAGEVLS
jgi:L-asparaginase/Glu-tRNA(Gln) amidotransferase subunit D